MTHIYLGLKPSINMLFFISEMRLEKFLMHAYFPGLLHNNMFDTWFKQKTCFTDFTDVKFPAPSSNFAESSTKQNEKIFQPSQSMALSYKLKVKDHTSFQSSLPDNVSSTADCTF